MNFYRNLYNKFLENFTLMEPNIYRIYCLIIVSRFLQLSKANKSTSSNIQTLYIVK